jgi:hypothetical protein
MAQRAGRDPLDENRGAPPPAPMEAPMSLDQLIAGKSFSPDQVQAMTAAYESARAEMKLAGGDSPIAEELPQAIDTVPTSRERNPQKMKQLALMILVRED